MKACRARGIELIALGEPDYPARLTMIDDAPPLLGVRGKRAILARPLVAIVGSRNASAAGVKFAERLARQLGEAGYGTVSGLARGIDAAAHRASLSTGTIAVLAGGHARIYPSEHVDLLDSIVTEGAAVSEMPLAWEPRARDFPRRNRLICLGRRRHRRGGAPLRSLITARLPASRPRSVRGARLPLDPRAEGTNGLLKQGATLVTEAADVIGAGADPRPQPDLPAPTLEQAPDHKAPLLLDSEPAADERNRIIALSADAGGDYDGRLSRTSPAIVRTVLLEIAGRGAARRRISIAAITCDTETSA